MVWMTLVVGNDARGGLRMEDVDVSMEVSMEVVLSLLW